MAGAQPVVVVEHNDGAAANAAFKFKTVMAPRPSAAVGATYTVIDGKPDDNSAPLDILHDGKVPDEEDKPDANFFFSDGEEGGRLLIDLGKVIPVKEVDTYSWHANDRAPQVYKLYGSDGTGDKFVAQSHRPQDPAQSGWKLLATVDTRTKFGKAGGQYAVSVTDALGIVGSYRYLILDTTRTETDDDFGNTFFSEIDVIDRDAPGAAAKPVATRPTKETTAFDRDGLNLVITNDAPGFDPKEQTRLIDTFFTVYPKMMAEYNKDAPKSVTIAIDSSYHGVAATGADVIHCNPDWFRRNPEDIDVITHEGMHVVQQYKRGGPGWLTEGLADYARAKFGVNNPNAHWTLPDYKEGQSYTDAYRVTARFLLWLEKHVKPGLAVTLDKAMRDGTYTPDIWKQQTGKTLDELWQDYGKNPAL